MTLRTTARTRRAACAGLIGLGMLALAGGCDPRTLLYFIQPFEPKIPAPGPSLKGQKVVILTHAGSFESYTEFPDLSDKLAKALGKTLEDNVKKIEVVDHAKVKRWIDGHPNYTEPWRAGLAFNADAVLFVEVEQFRVGSQNAPELLQGQSKSHVKLFKLIAPTDSKQKIIPGREKEEVVAHDEYVETTFPRTQSFLPVSASVNRSAFKKRFFEIFVAEIAWQFVPRVSGDMIQDTSF